MARQLARIPMVMNYQGQFVLYWQIILFATTVPIIKQTRVILPVVKMIVIWPVIVL